MKGMLNSIASLFLGSRAADEIRLEDLPRDEALWRTIFYSDELRRRPNHDVHFAMYGYDAKRLLSAHIHMNNMGLISNYDYEPEKKPGEFRILAFGGEQTASSVVSKSWPEFLQEVLQRRYPGRRYTVLNGAWPDAGPAHYIKYWEDEFARLAPDLVIINFAEAELYRTAKGTPATIRGRPIGHVRVGYDIDGLTAWTAVAHPMGSKVEWIKDRDAVVCRPYGFHAPIELMNNPKKVLQLQKRVVHELVTGGIERWFDPAPDSPIDRQNLLDVALGNFRTLMRNIPNLIFVHNFDSGDRTAKWQLTSLVEEADRSIKIVDPRTFIPAATSDSEINSWYMTGIMGEKFSDKGMQAYSEIIADIIASRLPQ